MAKENRDIEDIYGQELANTFRESLNGMDQLAEISKNDVARLPESLFINKLLPILTNTEGHQDITVWHDIAGTTLRAIDVYHDNTKEVLFRVPPLARQVDPKATGRGMHSAYQVISTAKQKHEVLPALGDQHIKSTLVSALKRTPVHVEDAKQWNAILERYGYSPLFDNPTDTEQPTVEDDSPFSGDYDDI